MRECRKLLGIIASLGTIFALSVTSANSNAVFGELECQRISELGADAYVDSFTNSVFGIPDCENPVSLGIEERCTATLAKRVDAFGVSLETNRGESSNLPSDVDLKAMLKTYAKTASKDAGISFDESIVGAASPKQISFILIPDNATSSEMSAILESKITRPDLLLTKERGERFAKFIGNPESSCVTFNLVLTNDEILHSQVWIKTPIADSALQQCIELGIMSSFGFINAEHLGYISGSLNSQSTRADFSILSHILLRTLYGLPFERGMLRAEVRNVLEASLKQECSVN